jgi:copper resistance protein B
MKALSLTLAPLAAGLLLAFNAAAQDHSQHQMSAPATQDHSQHQMPTPAAQDHSQHQQPKPKPKSKAQTKPEVEQAVPAAPEAMDHAAMGHGTPEQKPAEAIDHAAMGHDVPQESPEPVDHSAMEHDVPQESPEPVDHSAMGHDMPRPANQPVTPVPVLTDADRAAAVPPPNDHPVHDDTLQSFVLFNRLEGSDADEGTTLEWEGQAWIGTDLNKLWLRSGGERVGSHTEAADLEVLYGRAFARWWDVVAGVRHDFKPGASQDFAAIGVIGVAPYKYEVEATAYIGQSGQTAARLEAEYETLLTNRLILQPLVELNFYGQNDERRGIGSGLSTAEAGLRLRYEFTRQFAPYIGVVREWSFGRTADFRHDSGDDTNDTRFVAGVRIWF